MRAWWRRWVWVPRRDRWHFPGVPVSLAYMAYLIDEHYVEHLRAAMDRPVMLPWDDHQTHLGEHAAFTRNWWEHGDGWAG